MTDRYSDGNDEETPDQIEPWELEKNYRTSIQDDEGDEFQIELDYSYREFWGEVSDFECTCKPLTKYSMTIESMKESVRNEIYEKIKYTPKDQEIIIL